MRPGTKPKPTHLKVLQGNPGKRSLNKREPQAQGDLREPPEWLTESQKEGWSYAISHAPAGLLRLLDRSVLAVWVVAEDTHRSAAIALQRAGVLAKTTNGNIIQSPLLGVMNRQALIMLKAAGELGFTPSSRSRIISDIEDGGDPFLALIQRRQQQRGA